MVKHMTKGEKYNMLTFIQEVGRGKLGIIGEFICECGNKKEMYCSYARNNKVRSCGCLNKTKYENIVGKKFGGLTVLKILSERNSARSLYCLCLCDCGTEFKTLPYSIVKGKTTSCGCYNKKQKSQLAKELKTTHGMKNTQIYKVWQNMKQRCYYVNHHSYINYGGRGIEVCKEWKNSFEKFYEDMGIPPSNEYQIDRIDNNGNYCKDNCRWATRSDNMLNRRGNTLKNIYEYGSNGKYQVSLRRQNKRLEIVVDNLQEAINLRGKLIKEYKNNKEEWFIKYNNQLRVVDTKGSGN